MYFFDSKGITFYLLIHVNGASVTGLNVLGFLQHAQTSLSLTM